MKDRPQLSVVVPLYNEEECVMPLNASLVQVCEQLNVLYEFIFVDDEAKIRPFRGLGGFMEAIYG
jgi:glycosyltransferase involved in cell wall biosynthesis